MIAGRLGLDHDRVLFSRYAIPVMVRYLEQCDGSLSQKDRDKLLFWYVQSGMWGRYSGSTESYINQDIEAISGDSGSLDRLLEHKAAFDPGGVLPSALTDRLLGGVM